MNACVGCGVDLGSSLWGACRECFRFMANDPYGRLPNDPAFQTTVAAPVAPTNQIKCPTCGKEMLGPTKPNGWYFCQDGGCLQKSIQGQPAAQPEQPKKKNWTEFLGPA